MLGDFQGLLKKTAPAHNDRAVFSDERSGGSSVVVPLFNVFYVNSSVPGRSSWSF
jgi:hypothetical protein